VQKGTGVFVTIFRKLVNRTKDNFERADNLKSARRTFIRVKPARARRANAEPGEFLPLLPRPLPVSVSVFQTETFILMSSGWGVADSVGEIY